MMVNLSWQHDLIWNELKDKLLKHLWGDLFKVILSGNACPSSSSPDKRRSQKKARLSASLPLCLAGKFIYPVAAALPC